MLKTYLHIEIIVHIKALPGDQKKRNSCDLRLKTKNILFSVTPRIFFFTILLFWRQRIFYYFEKEKKRFSVTPPKILLLQFQRLRFLFF